MARVAIFGSSGMAGTAIARALAERGHLPVAVGRDRVPGPNGAIDLAGLGRLDGVVNAVVVKDASAPDAHWINAGFPHALAQACSDASVPLVHLSSDAVLSAAPGIRDEDCVPMPLDDYGRQKAESEPPSAFVLRFSMVGPEARGFTGLLCWLLSCQGVVEGFDDHLWNGVSSLELGRQVVALVENGIRPGLLHLCGETVTKAGLLALIAEAFQAPLTVRPRPSGVPRDQRLATRHPIQLPPLAKQIAELAAFADSSGRWKDSLQPR
ncbi:hypothetical protein CU669_08985 [Paramagnetospirillum kuznetsovii]|uniref:dTDP-4-dehydrorhamnose reductase n=1 Tax=Paramagnetospirillum kuznetsovii TaxID=2053833 RepID=A0A364NYU7_9PROT|nr:sugar nucleotide-binding protein [Paramagnetospirillum kuznetsovii]RAU22251.1 hypothetical protein CU669_08985 [Paramagnetospirillum kuznetsovii]